LSDEPHEFFEFLNEKLQQDNKAEIQQVQQMEKQEQQIEEQTQQTIETHAFEIRQENSFENIAEHSRQENIKALISSLRELPTTKDKPYSGLLELLRQVDPNNPSTDFDELTKQIKAALDDEATLSSLVFDLQAQDRQNGTHNFTDFADVASQFDPTLKARIFLIVEKQQLAL
jgi:hypothetical protein